MNNKIKVALLGVALGSAVQVQAARQVVVDVKGREKISVQIAVGSAEFKNCLRRNLELSGLFEVTSGGAITVSGASGAIKAEGRGQSMTLGEQFSDAPSAHMAARRFSDAMCKTFGNKEGFACDRIVFMNRGKALSKAKVLPSELCMGYSDGLDARQLTSDSKMIIYPRWMRDGHSVIYLSDKSGAPQVWQMDTLTGKRHQMWSFKGTVTGLAVAPDGNRVAAILSVHGNPELYVINNINAANSSWVRLTNTPLASEGQPTWSPDGRQIAYVSDETRRPQIYVIDVATKAKRRLTSQGRENIDPDWGKDGRIAYVTKRAGSQLAVMEAAKGDASAKIVDVPGTWEHPSWSRDGRNLVANSGGSLYVVDTEPIDGDKYESPKRMPIASGNWVSPSWIK